MFSQQYDVSLERKMFLLQCDIPLQRTNIFVAQWYVPKSLQNLLYNWHSIIASKQ